MKWIILLYFACPVGDVCGTPTPVVLPTKYDTLALCNTAAKVMISPAANPDGAVNRVQCLSVAAPAAK